MTEKPAIVPPYVEWAKKHCPKCSAVEETCDIDRVKTCILADIALRLEKLEGGKH